MKETRDDFTCVYSFGKDREDAILTAMEAGMMSASRIDDFISLANPIPTGDFWKAVEWADAASRLPSGTLAKLPQYRRTFAKKAGEALKEGKGIVMNTSSFRAREYREKNGLRGQRGTVYLFISRD